MSAAALLLLLALEGATPVTSPLRVEPRLLKKEKRVFTALGVGYLSRGDYYENPSLSASCAYYLSPRDAAELKAAFFVSFMTPAAQEVFQRTGLVPDAQRQLFHATLGWRRSLGYGKLLLETESPGVLHFDLQGLVRAGVAATDRAVNPMLALGPAFLVRFNDRLVLQLDVALQAALEERRSFAVPLGVQTELLAGVAW